MATIKTGVYPVADIQFKIGTKGSASSDTDMKTVKDMESFSLAIEGSAKNWNPMDQAGWERNLMTSKKLTVSLKGKRSVGDDGNDYVAATAYKNGLDCSTKASVEFPDGGKLTFDCVLDVKALGGDSTDIAPLEFDMIGDGKPTYTPAPVTPGGAG